VVPLAGSYSPSSRVPKMEAVLSGLSVFLFFEFPVSPLAGLAFLPFFFVTLILLKATGESSARIRCFRTAVEQFLVAARGLDGFGPRREGLYILDSSPSFV